ELKRLERTFVYSREGAGSLTVTDTVEFATPQTFGTALITAGKWERAGDGSLVVRDGEEAVRVGIGVTGGEFALQAEDIVEDAPVKPTRIGINMKQPVTTATVTLEITPVAAK
ncbi:MAG: heparinase, partial [Verrucomicrobiae bacterium]|nr:heparinase [Verrucomicrobiae bacterium]